MVRLLKSAARFIAGLFGLLLVVTPAAIVAFALNGLGFPGAAELAFPVVFLGTLMLMGHLNL